MACITEEEAKEMTPEGKWDYHEWCWYRGYGNCDLCALKGVQKPKIEQPKEQSDE